MGQLQQKKLLQQQQKKPNVFVRFINLYIKLVRDFITLVWGILSLTLDTLKRESFFIYTIVKNQLIFIFERLKEYANMIAIFFVGSFIALLIISIIIGLVWYFRPPHKKNHILTSAITTTTSMPPISRFIPPTITTFTPIHTTPATATNSTSFSFI